MLSIRRDFVRMYELLLFIICTYIVYSVHYTVHSTLHTHTHTHTHILCTDEEPEIVQKAEF